MLRNENRCSILQDLSEEKEEEDVIDDDMPEEEDGIKEIKVFERRKEYTRRLKDNKSIVVRDTEEEIKLNNDLDA